MTLTESETIVISTIRFTKAYYNDWNVKERWVTNFNQEEFAFDTLESCLQYVLDISKAKEFQLIPDSVNERRIDGYRLIMKVKKYW